MSTNPIFVSIPHSGEKIPDLCPWLKKLPEPILMCDVDRFIDRLYSSAIANLNLASVQTEWHRYAVDLNRIPTDVDQGSLVGASSPAGAFSRGFHWVHTTQKYQLMPEPMSQQVHQELTALIYRPFHFEIKKNYAELLKLGFKHRLHLDLHSMPSLGTSEHRDPGELRADIVVSDCQAQSADGKLVDLVISSYARAGFKVGYNWPYFGGRVSEQYGKPKTGQHAIQVELNRGLYMNEVSKQILPQWENVAKKCEKALNRIHQLAPQILSGL